jgi:uncharacterized repeat protein (TIGR03803 family)
MVPPTGIGAVRCAGGLAGRIDRLSRHSAGVRGASALGFDACDLSKDWLLVLIRYSLLFPGVPDFGDKKDHDMASTTPRCVAILVAAMMGAAVAFANPASAASYSVIYRFKGGSDGGGPHSTLLNAGGTLYGTTIEGGGGACRKGNGCGTVYSVTTAGAESVVYRFQGHSDGSFPLVIPTNVEGTLYGTTADGGGHGAGTVYSVTKAGAENVIYRFRKKGTGDGASPYSRLQNVNGTLYGTTYYGGGTGCGSFGCGTVYSVTPAGAETIIHAFTGGGDGALPYSGLLPVGTALYGTTRNGGGDGCNGLGCGTVFSISDTGVETIIHAFSGGDGAHPISGLTNVEGTLFGTTSEGGSADRGTVYAISSAGVENVVHSFKGGKDGWEPLSTLLNVGGTLYGTTIGGGGPARCNNFGCGTVYSITTEGVETVLYAFRGGYSGEGPTSALVDVNGTLYGTTGGGTGCYPSGCGMVYKIQP